AYTSTAAGTSDHAAFYAITNYGANTALSSSSAALGSKPTGGIGVPLGDPSRLIYTRMVPGSGDRDLKVMRAVGATAPLDISPAAGYGLTPYSRSIALDDNDPNYAVAICADSHDSG